MCLYIYIYVYSGITVVKQEFNHKTRVDMAYCLKKCSEFKLNSQAEPANIKHTSGCRVKSA